jgi:pimeloyl-ACP methyl ester carboxylesterase
MGAPTCCKRSDKQKKSATPRLFSVACIALGLTSIPGCQVVKVQQQSIAVSLTEERDSILTRSRLSEATLSVLSMTGQDIEQCVNDPYLCLKQLKEVSQVSDEQYLSTGSELLVARLDQLKQDQRCQSPLTPEQHHSQLDGLGNKIIRPVYSAPVIDMKPYFDCLAQQEKLLSDTVRYAYAYLFYSARDPKTRLFDNRQVQVRDFYNTAVISLAQIESEISRNGYIYDIPPELEHGNFHVQYFIRQNNQLKSLNADAIPQSTEIIAASELNFRGLRSINRRDGFGADFVAILPESVENPQQETNSYRLNDKNQNPSNGQIPAGSNIHPARYLPVTLTAIPRGNNIEEILNSKDIEFRAYNPYDFDTTTINQTEYPLSANFSAPYGLWLARTDLAAAAYLGLIAQESRLVAPHLYMLEPYNPNKRVIIMVHGLASSPEAWISLTHDVLGDPVLREHYQVWQVFYSTNMPILESRYQIHALIENTFNKVDPNHKNTASQHSVLIGHSMGAVISRLLMSNDNFLNNALADFNRKDRDKLLKLPVVQGRFKMQALPEVGRMVLISGPLRGTEYADRWFTRAIRKVIRLPQSFAESVVNGIKDANLDEKLIKSIHKITLANVQNGPSDLSKKSEFMHMTGNANIIANLPYHSIMGNLNGDVPLAETSDGIVPYNSAHLAGAVSEKVIKGGHSIQETPEAVLELRRILRLHLEKLGDIPPVNNLSPQSAK